MNITLEQAQQLDDILRRFPMDLSVITLDTENMEKFYSMDALLELLQRDGYIKKVGGMGTKKMIMILPLGRAFINGGGYTKEIKDHQEDEKLRKQYLETLIETNVSRHPDRTIKIICILGMIFSGIYFYYTMDDSKNIWENLNTYLSILGEVAFIGGFFIHKTTR